MYYNKQQRNEIYHKALEAFTKKDDSAFMCHELSKAKNPAGAPFTSQDELCIQFPEWDMCKPTGFTFHGSYGNIWEDGETKGSVLSVKEFNDLRETILCLAIAQL